MLAAPLAAGLLVLATHVPLGIEVLRRGIIFIDLAIAQVAALGVVAAGLFGWQSPWAIQGAAVAAALAGALLLTLSERRWPDLQEALIGLLFVTAAAAVTNWRRLEAGLLDMAAPWGVVGGGPERFAVGLGEWFEPDEPARQRCHGEIRSK